MKVKKKAAQSAADRGMSDEREAESMTDLERAKIRADLMDDVLMCFNRLHPYMVVKQLYDQIRADLVKAEAERERGTDD